MIKMTKITLQSKNSTKEYQRKITEGNSKKETSFMKFLKHVYN